MHKNIVISNTKSLDKVKQSTSQAGVEQLHVLADFDRTLTTAFVDGKSVPSLISILRDGNYLTKDYASKAHKLYDKYHPIEIDPNIPLDEKKRSMEEWWMTHFDLLIKSDLEKKDIERAVEQGKVKFRHGFSEFVDFLKANNIPLVIMSSTALGGDGILMYLEREGKLYDNIHIVSNSYQWDAKGKAIAVKEPIIHMMNKDETVLQDFPVFSAVKERKNVLLLGDSLGDVDMVSGFKYDNIIKIGFLNERVAENLEEYKRKYDVVILNDGSLDFVNQLLKEIS